jgi:hypothetical protein
MGGSVEQRQQLLGAIATMATYHEPTSIELLKIEGERRAKRPASEFSEADFDHHLETYRAFLWWAAVFVGHVAVILIGLALFLV